MRFLDNLAALIKVKTLVTLAVILVFVVLAITGKISADNVMIIVSSVISFYFGTQHEKDSNTESEAINFKSNKTGSDTE